MSLAILFFIFLYIALLVGVTVLGYHLAQKRAWNRWVGAGAGFLVIFLPVFGDWLPTVWLHSYYCETYAGLAINKTPEQWRKENPGVAETLVRQKPPLIVGAGDKSYFQLNQRFRWEIDLTMLSLGLKKNEERVTDGTAGTVLVRFIDFSTGQSGHNFYSLRDYKFWMYRESCEPQDNGATRKKFNQIEAEFAALGEQR